MRRLAIAFLLALLTSSSTVAVAWAGSAQVVLSCLDRSSIDPWGAGEIHVCAGDGQGGYSGNIKAADGYCVWWRIVWDNKPPTDTPKVCSQDGTQNFNGKAPESVSGVQDAFLEQAKV
ncbi:MAG: hypothetical protein ACRDRS_11035 [Pseudonocardiaceae bacterium]